MKLKLTTAQLGGNPASQWLRRAGYVFIVDHQSGQESFARRLGRDLYPRLHLYVQEIPGSEEIFFNLHLDQKKASYEGQTRHSGEYEGELVEAEVARLQSLLGQPVAARNTNQAQVAGSNNAPASTISNTDVLRSFKEPRLIEPFSKPAKQSWWQKLFN